MKNRTRGTYVFLATVLVVTTLFYLPTIDHFFPCLPLITFMILILIYFIGYEQNL